MYTLIGELRETRLARRLRYLKSPTAEIEIPCHLNPLRYAFGDLISVSSHFALPRMDGIILFPCGFGLGELGGEEPVWSSVFILFCLCCFVTGLLGFMGCFFTDGSLSASY
ncbi:hypothetical protein AVEN_169607-1 [Araneus ventricosus]|uniref:Uncharacterized protein n=1 Tax=Araneus ventricosus TaxID=182803 RepID=A0A4Y2HQ55_ARAVE|nr:hypothetical protein AVEN_169607-1 [Araneus ventricosus]